MSAHVTRALQASLLAIFFASCAGTQKSEIIVSVSDQKMLVLKGGKPVSEYPISTSKFGLGDTRGSYRTPLGRLEIAQKIGHAAPQGAVFKSRKRTGEILRPNAPGRDPIVTRILWLRGKEQINRNAYSRYIYIHGTPEERTIGTPASFGCIRMRSPDIARLFNEVDRGTGVTITKAKLEAFRLKPPASPAIRPQPQPPAPVIVRRPVSPGQGQIPPVAQAPAPVPDGHFAERWGLSDSELRRLQAIQKMHRQVDRF